MALIIEKVAKILAELMNLEQQDIVGDIELTAEAGFEPLDLAKLIIQCEKAFHLTIYDEDVHTFKKVKDLVAYIQKAQGDD